MLKRKKKKTLNFVYAVFTFMFAYEGMVAMRWVLRSKKECTVRKAGESTCQSVGTVQLKALSPMVVRQAAVIRDTIDFYPDLTVQFRLVSIQILIFV